MGKKIKSIFDRPHVLFNLVSSLLEVSLLKVAGSTISYPVMRQKSIFFDNIVIFLTNFSFIEVKLVGP